MNYCKVKIINNIITQKYCILNFISRIIQHMKEIARRLWVILISSFFGLLGIVVQIIIFLAGKSYELKLIISFSFMAIIVLLFGLLLLAYDVQTTWIKEHTWENYDEKSIKRSIKWWQWWKWKIYFTKR